MRIDSHVHLRDGNEAHKETIEHGLQVAKEQGVDIVFDMPNTDPPIICFEDIQKRLAMVPPEAKKRYFLFVGLTGEDGQTREALSCYNRFPEVIGLKLFAGKSVGGLSVTDEDKQYDIYEMLAKHCFHGVLAVHCEKESLLKPEFWDPMSPVSHCDARPKEAEIESIRDQITFAQGSDFIGTLHICHITCPEAVQLVDDTRKSTEIEFKITCGVTPHHLLWTSDKLAEPNGIIYKTNPPLRSADDVKYLRQCVRQGLIDWIETDHAPHALGEKLFGPYPSGFPSLYLYRYLVGEYLPDHLKVSPELIEAMTFGNIVKAFGARFANDKLAHLSPEFSQSH